jgi:hypothetical protein
MGDFLQNADRWRGAGAVPFRGDEQSVCRKDGGDASRFVSDPDTFLSFLAIV